MILNLNLLLILDWHLKLIFTISEKDKIPYYLINVDDEERNKQIDRIASRFGTLKDADEVSENEMIKADMVEVDKQGNPR